ncbi:High mobility group proteins HMG-I and HMG-Y:Pseudouridine synthase, Rsu:RNA-binding S4:Pseudouridine synthase [Fulvimarina pelagi HTCC2506]|uniref:Pseudouridine synthase n=1 Tax=Fulvimarina pelagi HTCC2506 TaxID=314231 RepID=Q0G3T3_9HYPH|nr:pseudouridine synthase [Fulvimarina pelagi]EAU41748.1 High mobility group proteins HMG-I and HMG-Y:Pseudouridine synthase, Rsu:RNA-binding S4:Pseudouridine synthase [Fulvimarina pelagi HTCC2506]
MSDDEQDKRGGKGGRPGGGGFRRGGKTGEGGKRPFVPKSRGMKSHGGARDGEAPRKPKSYGTRNADASSGSGERSFRPKPAGERPRGENRDWQKRGEGRDAGGERKGGFERRRPSGDRPARAESGERPDRGFKPRGDRPERSGDRPNRRFEKRDDRGQSRGRDDQRRERRPMEDEAAAGQQADMRIARRLARAGIASRRDAEAMIVDGRVKVNGKIIDSPALDVKPTDRIEVDGALLPQAERTRLWLFHKPAGTVTTNKDPEGRRTVFDMLPEDMPRVLSIGRLDINTEGLLLLTNDGGLSRVLELPSTGWLRRYRVRAHGSITQAKLDELRNGISVDGVFYGAIEATLDREQGSNVWITLGLREGKNREVKNVLGALGLEVNRLIRLSYGPFQLGDLAEGSVREVKGRTLRDQLGDRLVEEAGVDFDGPINKPFSNAPVEGRQDARPSKKSDWVSAGGKVDRKTFGEKKREEALGRLDTKPRGKFGDKPGDDRRRGDRRSDGPKRSFGEDRGGKGGGRFDKHDKREGFGDRVSGARSGGDRPGGDRDGPSRKPEGQGRRMSNVWMAPGSKPERDPGARPAKTDGDGPKTGKRALADPKRRVSRPPSATGKGKPGRPGGPRKPGGPRGAARKPSGPSES